MEEEDEEDLVVEVVAVSEAAEVVHEAGAALTVLEAVDEMEEDLAVGILIGEATGTEVVAVEEEEEEEVLVVAPEDSVAEADIAPDHPTPDQGVKLRRIFCKVLV